MKVRDTFNIPTLTVLIGEEFIGEPYVKLKLEYDFLDAAVTVSGSVQEDFRYEQGDWLTPPSYSLVSRVVDLDEVLVSYNDEHEYKLSAEELEQMEINLRK